MKLLIVTTAFPPVGGSHVQRVLNLANYLSKFGNDVSVIGYDPGENYPNKDYSNIEEINSSISIKYVKEGILHRNLRNSTNMKTQSSVKKNYFDNLKSYLKKLGNQRKKQILIPDTQIDWFSEVKKMEKKERFVQQFNPDVIISCSMPNTSHIVGYWLAKKYKKPLVMDYGDPWSFEISVRRNFLRKNLELILEKKILEYSSLAFFATKETKNIYSNYFPKLSSKFNIFMMGYTPKRIEVEKKIRNENLSMIYGGMLNPIHRNPVPFLYALCENKNLDVLIRSVLTPEQKIEYSEIISNNNLENVHFEGLTDFNSFMKELSTKDVLVLFGNSTPTQIAGKVFNYIATGKHILYIKNFSEKFNDPVEEILKEYGNVTVVKNEKTEISNGILTLINLKKKGQLKEKINSSMNKYTWEQQVSIFSKKLIETFNTK